ncbi:hypothetical protein SAMN05660909_04406 [Chitinophaga terrae (ex Kim and Jung 2007)]|uniref:DUF5710 domain-containing protein n=1 Tax=Chitinophaga terrae (ex Kim and Jung 2007) TaxID=408074 RepID=A0A1H4FIE7_9BACT|nr:hypothetical protein [Chitinophaga terrae (ex Kim and Jung 2007)]GEP92516.1 hypothetical protein CTE07_41610 [Chitinophaga terrae (ex Kim and Jung 2007)]SEA96827.1 hypothetical protein SAMN05660909_04406 [Chitinophaga terrae (ex Kim and Jung 2007)]
MSLLLNVPPAQVELAKAKGAKWNDIDQSWYLPAEDFDRLVEIDAWIPQQHPCIILPDPVTVLYASGNCWKCDHTNRFIALAAGYFYEKDHNERDELTWMLQDFFAVFEQVTDISDHLQAFLRNKFPFYKYAWSEIAGKYLWLNHCSICQARQEDNQLFDTSNGIFHPTSQTAADLLQLHRFHFKYNPVINADYEIGEHARLINEYSSRIG